MDRVDPVDDRRRLIDANHAFYRALEDLDLAAMEAVWFHDASVRCVHPGWDALAGWEQVRYSFQQIFAGTRWIRVIPTAIEAIVIGDAGIVTCTENITATRDDDVGVAVAQATNIFRRTAAGWRMILHHASPAPVSVTESFSGTVQ
ncbi:MAG TPA: nuclear transport factor 2 family protein [Vicinamibacteria bacterium]|nr:nuclear transport factor 2 family protein [Vicinamibacteria bacterium]